MSESTAPSKKPWHRWAVGAVLLAQALFELTNIAAAFAIGSGRTPAPVDMAQEAVRYYAALADWEHIVGLIYSVLLGVTAIGVFMWAGWTRIVFLGRAIIHIAYFSFHLATSTYVPTFGITGFAIFTGVLGLTGLYVLLLVGRKRMGQLPAD
ncbi:hypothetical protein [Aquidulcibacter sp.]|uniref:hypothetical protein n=1 Tax=Aquidulcibacter sp. TaxID=2052990 RepID=UPI0025C5BF04|nr:hypothetical protein [Aquidulcibacter sp.]MCA3692885.1 hypothetical protein [Aquidulcibacter sp.]